MFSQFVCLQSTIKKAKAKELLHKAKTRQASKTSPSKPKKSRTKSQDKTIELLNSSREGKPDETKTLRNFKDVLGKKVVAKDKEVDVKKKKVVPKEDVKKVDEDNAKTDGVIKRQRHENCVTIKPKKKTNPDEPKKGMMTFIF